MLPTRSSSATVTTSTSFELASSHARVTSIKFTKQEWVSQLVSQSVSDKGKQWSDSGPIKKGKVEIAMVFYLEHLNVFLLHQMIFWHAIAYPYKLLWLWLAHVKVSGGRYRGLYSVGDIQIHVGCPERPSHYLAWQSHHLQWQSLHLWTPLSPSSFFTSKLERMK